MSTAANRPSPVLRTGLVAGALAVLAVWAWTWIPVIAAWNMPGQDGFVAIPAVMATMTILPLGLFALYGALRNQRGELIGAAVALAVCAVLIAAVAGIEISGNIYEAQNAA